MPLSPPEPLALNRSALADWYLRNRKRSRALFDLLDPQVYYSRPISLRNPIVFYVGHLPAFSLISLVERGAGERGVDERLERLFARGIDPDSEDAAVPRSGAATLWPPREEVLQILRESGGVAGDAEDDEILAAQSLLARTEGIWAGPTGVATLAVLIRLLAAGALDRDSAICAILSETGLKTDREPPAREGRAFDEASLRRLIEERLAVGLR